jgi:hypothetical protein
MRIVFEKGVEEIDCDAVVGLGTGTCAGAGTGAVVIAGGLRDGEGEGVGGTTGGEGLCVCWRAATRVGVGGGADAREKCSSSICKKSISKTTFTRCQANE